MAIAGWEACMLTLGIFARVVPADGLHPGQRSTGAGGVARSAQQPTG
jgi:hypothetical protein